MLRRQKGNTFLALDADADGLLSRDFIEKATPVFDYGYVAVQGRYIPSNRNYSFITKLLAIEGDLHGILLPGLYSISNVGLEGQDI